MQPWLMVKAEQAEVFLRYVEDRAARKGWKVYEERYHQLRELTKTGTGPYVRQSLMEKYFGQPMLPI
jgi:hypothetical protein